MTKPRRTTRIALPLLVVALSIALMVVAPWRRPFHVSGVVVDRNGQPVPFATVSVRERSPVFLDFTRTRSRYSTVRASADGSFSVTARGHRSMDISADAGKLGGPIGVRSHWEYFPEPGTYRGVRLVLMTEDERTRGSVTVGSNSATAWRAATRAAAVPATSPATDPAAAGDRP